MFLLLNSSSFSLPFLDKQTIVFMPRALKTFYVIFVIIMSSHFFLEPLGSNVRGMSTWPTRLTRGHLVPKGIHF